MSQQECRRADCIAVREALARLTEAVEIDRLSREHEELHRRVNDLREIEREMNLDEARSAERYRNLLRAGLR
jgi:hypothetical protein